MEPDLKPLADLLFGPARPNECKPDDELASLISAWFRARQAQLRDGASFGTPSADLLQQSRQQP
ncbi:MAG TPA: hypothetical protein VMG10_08070 [Gemmataceae bacterium]|nr:hypothetical protein [Gemmataceae bacterium]